MMPLNVQNLTFDGNKGPQSQGSAYMDASFENASRTTCNSCHSMTRGDSVGSLPSQFHLMLCSTCASGFYSVLKEC